MLQLVIADAMEREGTHQGVDVSGPKDPKGGLSVEVTSKPPPSSFRDCTLIQSRKSEHVQPFALPFFRNIVCICFQREVLFLLPKVESQSIHHNEVGQRVGRKDDGYM